MKQFKALVGQKVRNKQTNKIIDVKDIQDIGNGKKGQFFSQDYEIYNPKTETSSEYSPPALFGTAKYTGGSNLVREKVKNNNQKLDEGIKGLEDNSQIDYGLSYNTDEINKLKNETDLASQNIQKMIDAEKILSTDDTKDIEKAGILAGQQYDPLIQKAREAKRSGLPKAIITAGERGGFMNTQFAGIAALVPTEGGDFLGAGGKLEEIKTKYDSIISNLQTQKERAIAAAKSAAKQAKLTGKKEDTDRAIIMYGLAKDKYQEALDMVDKKLNFDEKKKEYERNQLKWTRKLEEWGVADKDKKIQDAKAQYLVEKLWEDRQRKLSQDYGYNKIDKSELNNYDKSQYITIKNPITNEDDYYLRPKGQSGDFDIIKKWREKYPGAGIDIYKDNFDTAWAKVVETDEYREKHKLDEDWKDKELSGTDLLRFNVPAGSTWGDVIGLKPKETLTGVDKFKEERILANDFEKYAKESRTAMRNINIIKTGYDEAVKMGLKGDSLNPASQAILVTFQKMLDPTSVVRESEYARSSHGESWVNRLKGLATTIRQGGANVPMKSLKNFYDMSLELEKGYNEQMLDFAKRTQHQAETMGLDIKNILTPKAIDLLSEYSTPEDVLNEDETGDLESEDTWNF